VAIYKRWEVEDLRAILDTSRDLYKIAVHTYKLKEGVVRYIKRDLYNFKKIYCAEEGLN
jgi:hypothetical protein